MTMTDPHQFGLEFIRNHSHRKVIHRTVRMSTPAPALPDMGWDHIAANVGEDQFKSCTGQLDAFIKTNTSLDHQDQHQL